MTQPLQIIAFTGSAGTGKDTAADILVTHCGFTKLAFADALRTEVQAAFVWADGMMNEVNRGLRNTFALRSDE